MIILLLGLSLRLANCQQIDNSIPLNVNSSTNDSSKDMYVIHAMVYQVGILTNSSDYAEHENETLSGAQEALTFYHTNGSSVDLSNIPTPLLTNITGQNFVGVAPVSKDAGDQHTLTWSAGRPETINAKDTGYTRVSRATKDASDTYVESPEERNGGEDTKLSDSWMERMFRKREIQDENDTEKFLKVVNGSAVIPQGAGIQSVALPPLLSLNTNLSDIPVPIPNTSIVHYARVNTMITSTNMTT